MKLLYCPKCKLLFNLTRKHSRSCECGEVKGQYRDKRYAIVSVSNQAVSIAIDTADWKKTKEKMRRRKKQQPNSVQAVIVEIDDDSWEKANKEMRRLEKQEPNSNRKAYKSSSLFALSLFAWVRPNDGPGNPHSYNTHRTLKKSAGRSS